MRKICSFVTLLGVFALFALPAAAMNHEVKVADKAEIGTYLTDAEGLTLYIFKKDIVGHSACSGSCLDNWPVFYREKVAPPAGVIVDDFATITRDDGTMQTTFRGFPLYYYKGDSKAGDTRGNDMMGLWAVVDPGHFPVK